MRTFYTILLMAISLLASGRTILVGKGQRMESIRAALTIATDGDTIRVLPGHYREGSLTITRSITLIGVGYPELDGEFKYENLVISGRDITVDGFLLRDSRHSSSNDYAAVSIIDATRITIRNNKIINAHFGVHVANSTHCSINNNRIAGQARSEQSSGNGIHIWKSDHARITGNHITGHRDGIYFEFVTESDITGNTSENNIRYGLHFMFSHKDNYIRNIFRNNGTGVAVMYSRNVRMEDNIFSRNWGTAAYGILLKDISDSYMIHNRFLDNTVGIFMEGTNRVAVQQNLFRGNGWAMRVQANCEDNHINNNNFEANTFDVATNGTLVLSDFSRNYWDKYEGYDINHDGVGDVPYHPVSMYSMVIENTPSAVILLRSFMVSLLDKAEKAIPSLTPENLADPYPAIKPNKL